MEKLIILLLFLATFSSVSSQESQSLHTTAEFYDVADFIQQIDTLRKDANIPGLSMAVVKDRAIVLAIGLGYADIENGIQATAETPYDIASVAKPLSAAVALKLVEMGMLDLDRRLNDYSEWDNFCTDFSRQPSIFARELNCDASNHTLRHLLSHTAVNTPGTHFSYNPVLFSWASRPMMSVSEISFSELVEKYVLKPANMKMSARKYRDLPLREDLAELQAQPYQIDSSGIAHRAPERSPQGDGAAGGVVSTVLDLAKFDIALDKGMLISLESRAKMMTATNSMSGEKLPYGLGWFVQDYEGLKLVWHSGWWENAYSALYLKIPEQNLSFIILANSEGIWWNNRLDDAEVNRSKFAQSFISAFIK